MACVLASAHNRLEEAHKFWHDALIAYQESEVFRASVNACIQALRNTTWILQGAKENLKEFDSWYAPIQDRMRADQVLSWLVRSRNLIVKQADLELRSRAYVSVFAWATEPLAYAEVPPFLSTELIAVFVVHNMPPNTPRIDPQAEAVIKIERRWVVNDFPDQELLELLASCFEKIREVLQEAHAHFKLQTEDGCDANNFHTAQIIDLELPGCMKMISERRSINVSYNDKKIIKNEEARSIPKVPSKVIESRYGLKTKPPPSFDVADPFSAGPYFCEMAKRMLKRDKTHGTIFHLWKKGGETEIILGQSGDRSAFYVMMRGIAERVEKSRASAVVMIGESWYTVGTKDEVTRQRPSASPRRKEALQIIISDPTREVRYVIPFSRGWLGGIKFGEIEVLEDGFNNSFLPIYEAWERLSMMTRQEIEERINLGDKIEE